MSAYEYRVVPAPQKGLKAKGVKTPDERFALALQEVMNQMGAEGWQYLRADTLPSTERSGLAGSTTNWRHVLVFQRQLMLDAAQSSDVHEDTSEEVQPPFNRTDAETPPAPLPQAPTLHAADSAENIEKSDA